jgi:TolB-like protein
MGEELARTSHAVRVVTPILAARESRPEIQEIGRRCHAEVVLEGSLQTVGKDARIFLMLARTADVCGIWAESYDSSLDDLRSRKSKTLRAIAEDVARALQSEKANIPIAVA